VSFSKLTEAIRTVVAGGRSTSPVVTERLLRGFQSSPPSASEPMIDGLTEREIEVLRLMTAASATAKLPQR
jgi:DNA-binding NarL/FixJ family response regulator